MRCGEDGIRRDSSISITGDRPGREVPIHVQTSSMQYTKYIRDLNEKFEASRIDRRENGRMK